MQNLSKKQLIEELQKRDEEIVRLNQEVTLLRQKMDFLIRRVFGRSSEKMDAGQLDLFLLNLSDEPGKVRPPRCRRLTFPRMRQSGAGNPDANAGPKTFLLSRKSSSRRKSRRPRSTGG